MTMEEYAARMANMNFALHLARVALREAHQSLGQKRKARWWNTRIAYQAVELVLQQIDDILEAGK